ncbi:uncharacterized protein VTP21DRAFT_9577 [Calcarisporiella thermophila]|uniref:uncharacterized protein n=1 Tax=Calcarisporiella thermophila TaxID=911321 RepID=UPI0037445EEA
MPLIHAVEYVAPISAVLAIALLPLGPLLFPRAYILFLLSYFSLFLYLSINHFFKFCITVRQIKRNVRRWNQYLSTNRSPSSSANGNNGANNATLSNSRVSYDLDGGEEDRLNEMESALKPYDDHYFVHAFIIPNYNEPEALLRDTIKRLASHRHARTNYVIILAMEAREVNQVQKGASLQSQFESNFLHFIVTAHPAGVPGEAPGKGSNVSYAARVGCSELVHRGIDKRRIIITNTDSDASIPELYVQHVEKTLNEADDPYALLLAPPIFFSRNSLEVPAPVRVTDIVWSIMVMQNLSNGRGMAIPCSTYTLSLMLAERVGYWDVDAGAIGEDMHMFLKVFFRTDGYARGVPIYVPVNMTNVQTTGFMSNMYARYVQARRHYKGVADVAYALRSALVPKSTPLDTMMGSQERKSNAGAFLDKFLVCLHVLEAHMIPVTSGWLMFAAVPVTQFLLFPPAPLVPYVAPAENPILTSEFYATIWNLVKILTVLLPMPLLACVVLYEGLHRVVERELFRKPRQGCRSFKNAVDYLWLPVSAWLFMTLPSTIASVQRFFREDDHYHVAEKVFNGESDSEA